MKLQDKIANGKWMIKPTSYNVLLTLLEHKPSIIEKIVDTTVQMFTGGKEEEFNTQDSNTDMGYAYIPVDGVLVKGCSEEDAENYGLCNIDVIKEAFIEALNDDTVSHIILGFNSPGGEVTGIPELARLINNSSKPTIGWTETTCASAAYYLMSQCDMIGMTPSANVGSVGVYSLIQDITKKMENDGIKLNAIHSGKYKLIGHEFHTLTPEEEAILQTDITNTHDEFKQAVNSKRNISDDDLQGLSYGGKEALDKNFCDILVDDIEGCLTTDTINNMSKFTKINTQKLAVAANISTKAEEPVKVEPKDVEESNTITPVKLEEHKMVACPHCKHEFAVENKEESKAEDVKEEPKVEDKKVEEKTEDKVEPKAEDKPEDKPEDKVDDEKKAERLVVTKEGWNSIRGYASRPKSTTMGDITIGFGKI